MKKLMSFAVMMLSAMTASAQQKVGKFSVAPKVGLQLSTVTKIDNSKMKLGSVAGADFNYQVAEKFAVSAGLFYSMQGCKYDFTEKDGSKIDANVMLEYINVPIMAQYYVIPGLALKAGVQPGFNVKHKIKTESGKVSVEGDIDNFKSFDLSIPLGASYQFGDFMVEARYNLGLTKLYDSTDGKSRKNSVFQVTFGYVIPFGK